MMSPVKPGPNLVLQTVGDLDPSRVSMLRRHGAKGGAISLALPKVPVAASVRSEMRINASARDCGCETGSRVATIALVAILVWGYLRSGSLVPQGAGDLLLLVAGVLLGALAGKAVGITKARRRLTFELSQLRAATAGA